ncbi:MAG: acyl-CoA dehydrogenase, partial [Gammaproteobacteria bacterium]
MALVLNEEQQMLRDSAAGFLAEKAPVSALRALRDGGEGKGFETALWQEMVDMGWAGIAIDENYGGLGYGYVGLGLILEQCGRTLSASPLQSSVLVAASVVNQLGSDEQKRALLGGIASGAKIMTLAMQETAHHGIENVAMTATAQGDEYVLNGRKVFVLDAAQADQFIVIARTSGSAGEQAGLTGFLVDANAKGLAVIDRTMVDSRSAG